MACEVCNGTGHVPLCDCHDVPEDIGDLIARSDCPGCCPNGCRPKGFLREEAQRARAKALRLLESLEGS